MSIFLNHTAESRKFVAAKATRLRQCYRLQPELRILLRSLHMDVPRLVAFATEKEEPESPRAQHFRHGTRLLPWPVRVKSFLRL